MYLETALQNIDNMLQDTFERIIKKYVKMNVLRPSMRGMAAARVFS